MSFCKCQQSHQSWYCVKICTKSCAEFCRQNIISDVHNLWLGVTCDWRFCLLVPLPQPLQGGHFLLLTNKHKANPFGHTLLFKWTFKESRPSTWYIHWHWQILTKYETVAFYWNCFFATMVSTNHGAAATLSKNKHSHFLEINQINTT